MNAPNRQLPATDHEIIAFKNMCHARNLNPGDFYRRIGPMTHEDIDIAITRLNRIPIPPHFSSPSE